MLFKIINRGVEHVSKIISEIISEIKFEFFNMGVKGRNFSPHSDFCSLLGGLSTKIKIFDSIYKIFTAVFS